MATEKEQELEKKLKTMFQAMQRMERLLKATELKASRGVDQSRKNTMEITKLKSLLNRRD
jgi:hypothetical protein